MLVRKFRVPRKLDNAHGLIAKLLSQDEERRDKQAASRYPSVFDNALFDSPFEQRRLRLLNAIFLALARCGMKPTLHGKDPQQFGVEVGDQHVSFTLDGKRERREGIRFDEDLRRPASEKLRLEISRWQKPSDIKVVWEDKPDARIEKFVEHIVIGLIVAGELQYRQEEIAANEWLKERQAELIEEAQKLKEEEARKERERKLAAERARIERLLGDAEAFRQASDIRAYVESVRTANRISRDPVAEPEVEAWASWALAEADRIDPVLSKRFLKQGENQLDEA